MPVKKRGCGSSTKDDKPETLSHEEHQARAMLMGMRYHHGNGDPFYYKGGESLADIDVSSMIDANTLESMVVHDPESDNRWLSNDGARAHLAWVKDNLDERDARIAKREAKI